MKAPSWLRRFGRALLALTLLGVTAGEARANGRFPSASYFVAGPGPESRVLSMRTTFGLITSLDGGRSWGWVCEEALDAVGMFDSSMDIGFDGTIVVGSQRGLIVSRGPCTWSNARGSPMREMADIASDATGRYMVTIARTFDGTADTVLTSMDGGSSWANGVTLRSFFTETVEMAPSDRDRIYISGFLSGAVPVMLRSDDGGLSVREVARGMAFSSGSDVANGVFIAGVDPTNPSVVYVRAALGLGTLLLRSDDGGATWRELTRTANPMTGFAMSDDGSTIWVASTNRAEGIRRSERGGPFRRVAATVTARCLRQHGGVLYVCADEVADGYLLGCSTNGGERFEALLSARNLTGVSPTCPAGTMVGSVCSPLWPAVSMPIREIDAGTPPVGVFHDASLVDLVSTVDRLLPVDAVEDARLDSPLDAAPDGEADAMSADAAPDDASDATPEIGDEPTQLDVAADGATPDLSADSPAEIALDAAPDLAEASLDAARIDGTLFDASIDDATADGGRTGSPPPERPACGCRARSSSGGLHTSLLMLSLVLLSRRRRAAV